MDLEFLVKKHDAEIMEIKSCLSELSNNITAMLIENKHINGKLTDLIEVTDDVREMGFTIKNIQTLYIEMKAKIDSMNASLVTLESRIANIERNSNKFSKFMKIIRDYWQIIFFSLPVVLLILEFLHKNRLIK